MLEIVAEREKNTPRILVMGIGGGGNNAIERMVQSNLARVSFAAVNTDVQVLEECNADFRVQIGKKLTKGYGTGADPTLGEAAALESEEEIKALIAEYDMVILTCGMGGGTGTGATPILAKYCKEAEILTVAVVTLPFGFEGAPRIAAAECGVSKLKPNVDTLLVIPNDKLLKISDKPLFLEDAFDMADSVLKYAIEGITNIVFNKGTINLDFNDLKTTLINKGMGHLGIGTVRGDQTIVDAVKIAVNSPLLDTSVAGAQNLLINTCGRVNIVALNEAVEYVRSLAGERVNIIWGTVTDPNADKEEITVTVIATGIPDGKSVGNDKKITVDAGKVGAKKEASKEFSMPEPPVIPPVKFSGRPEAVRDMEIVVPEFLSGYRKKN